MKKILSNPLVIIGLVIALIFVLSVYRKGLKQKSVIENATQPSVTKQVATEIELSPQSQEPDASHQENLNRQRVDTAMSDDLGLRTINGTVGGGELTLSFEFKGTKKWCQAGELDTLQHAVADSAAPEILISLEAMDSDNRSGFYTSVNSLKLGVMHDFKIKNSGSSFGLYICLDSAKDKSCKRKRLVEQTQMNAELADSNATVKSKDYIFYYQPLVLYKNQLTGYRTDTFSDEFKSSVSKVLEDKHGLAAAYFKASWDISNVTRSIPVAVRNNKMLIELPYNDPRCSGF